MFLTDSLLWGHLHFLQSLLSVFAGRRWRRRSICGCFHEIRGGCWAEVRAEQTTWRLHVGRAWLQQRMVGGPDAEVDPSVQDVRRSLIDWSDLNWSETIGLERKSITDVDGEIRIRLDFKGFTQDSPLVCVLLWGFIFSWGPPPPPHHQQTSYTRVHCSNVLLEKERFPERNQVLIPE